MRISDWSSDVCSSDLAGAAWVFAGIGAFVWMRMRSAPKGRRFTAEMLGISLAHFGRAVFVDGVLLVESLGTEQDVATVQIVRASCRDSGCQYVDIAGDSVDVQKKTYKQNPPSP